MSDRPRPPRQGGLSCRAACPACPTAIAVAITPLMSFGLSGIMTMCAWGRCGAAQMSRRLRHNIALAPASPMRHALVRCAPQTPTDHTAAGAPAWPSPPAPRHTFRRVSAPSRRARQAQQQQGAQLHCRMCGPAVLPITTVAAVPYGYSAAPGGRRTPGAPGGRCTPGRPLGVVPTARIGLVAVPSPLQLPTPPQPPPLATRAAVAAPLVAQGPT